MLWRCLRSFIHVVCLIPTEPKITKFPEDKHVIEGEKVVLKVKVTGIPQPKVTWYHNGEEVEADYSRELSEDGSLTMPSAEGKHSGVYQLVAVNKSGRVKREVKLTVDSEDTTTRPSDPKTGVLLASVPVSMLGNHVKENHSKNNSVFRDEYQVILIST